MKNDNNWKKTKSDVKLFSEWLHKENEDRLIEDIEKDKLDQYLARFFLAVSILAWLLSQDTHIGPERSRGPISVEG
jgi:hypothetical protein